MSDQPFYAPNRLTAPRQPRVGEHLWAIRKDGRQLDCEVRDYREWGVESKSIVSGSSCTADAGHPCAGARGSRGTESAVSPRGPASSSCNDRPSRHDTTAPQRGSGSGRSGLRYCARYRTRYRRTCQSSRSAWPVFLVALPLSDRLSALEGRQDDRGPIEGSQDPPRLFGGPAEHLCPQ
jgi:hypothetical protein